MRGQSDRRPRVDVFCDAESHERLTVASFVKDQGRWKWDDDLAMQADGAGATDAGGWYSSPKRRVLLDEYDRYDLACPQCGLDLPRGRAKWEQQLEMLHSAGRDAVGLAVLVATLT